MTDLGIGLKWRASISGDTFAFDCHLVEQGGVICTVIRVSGIFCACAYVGLQALIMSKSGSSSRSATSLGRIVGQGHPTHRDHRQPQVNADNHGNRIIGRRSPRRAHAEAKAESDQAGIPARRRRNDGRTRTRRLPQLVPDVLTSI